MPGCELITEEALWRAAESEDTPLALQQHCLSCRDCRDALREMQRVVTGLAALKVLDGLAPRPAIAAYLPRRRVHLRWALGLAAAAVFCLALLCISMFSQRQIARQPLPSPRLPRPGRVFYSETPKHEVMPLHTQQPPEARIVHSPMPRPHHRRTLLHGHTRPARLTPSLREQAPAPSMPEPALIPIVGTIAAVPPDAIRLDSDRVLPLVDAPEVSNQVYQVIETVGEGNTPDCQKIYDKTGGG